MATYLLTWNPDRFRWNRPGDSIREDMAAILMHGFAADRWSCGRSKRLHRGDRAFLMRVGLEPKGIMGSGFVSSDVFDGPHWGEPNKTTRYVDLVFDRLLDAEVEPILSEIQLRNDAKLS